MSTQLIQHLKQKCEADDNVKILLSQWEFDQKLVAKALENIGGFYPHFSNHNASHSNQILVNIERILGKDLNSLSATDTWLLLEAAYWHDVGMLVDAKNAKAAQEIPEFLFMVKTIAADKSHDLHLFCQHYEQGGWSTAIASEPHPYDGAEKYRQLIAEWFRRNHDKRIGDLVMDPFSELRISSPRTELLPNRLYRYLGQICMSHGMSFPAVMEKLPFKQTGLGVEDCHPRFVGCLLRLGDLFDLDDNRFCPVMSKHVSNMPCISQHHKDKHLSLREFQLDKRTVKLVAECPNEMSYIETQNWFGWIREEFQNQMSQWNLIVPNADYAPLPTIEQLDVKMEVKYENGVKKEKILLNNKPMKFSLDEHNAIEILEGSGLYKDETNIFRELIQNAIDATLMRVWLDAEKGIIELPKKSHPYHHKIIDILNRYPIKISFDKVNDIENSDDSWWEISIQDKGVGIGLETLSYMQKIAGSSRNLDRQKIIERMPAWMRPSGQFGIGLHSAFLLLKNLHPVDQKLIIITTNLFDNKALKIELNSPLSSRQGYCFIEQLDAIKYDVGTKIIIKTKLKRRGYNFKSPDSNLYKLVYSKYDPVREEKFDFLHTAIRIDEILSSVTNSACTKFVFNKYWQDLIDLDVQGNNFNENLGLWVNEYSLYLYIFQVKNNILTHFNGLLRGSFKGQKVSELRYYFMPFGFLIDFYGYNAKDVLKADRNDWKSEFKEEFLDQELLHKICKCILIHYRDEIKKKLNDENLFSLFCYFFGDEVGDDIWKDLVLFSEPYTNYKYKNDNCILYGKSYRYILGLEDFTFTSISDFDIRNFDIENLDDNHIVTNVHFSGWCKRNFDKEWSANGGYVIEKNVNGCLTYKYSKKIEENSFLKLKNSILDYIDRKRKRIIFDEQEWLNFGLDKYFSLFTKSKIVERVNGLISLDSNQLILPFLFNYDLDLKLVNIKVDYSNNDELVSETWLARDDKYADMTLNDFEELYRKLELEIHEIMKDCEQWKIN